MYNIPELATERRTMEPTQSKLQERDTPQGLTMEPLHRAKSYVEEGEPSQHPMVDTKQVTSHMVSTETSNQRTTGDKPESVDPPYDPMVTINTSSKLTNYTDHTKDKSPTPLLSPTISDIVRVMTMVTPMSTPRTPTMHTPIGGFPLLDMPDITSLFPMDNEILSIPPTPNMMILPTTTHTDSRTTPKATPLEMRVYHIPEDTAISTQTICDSLLTRIDLELENPIPNKLDDRNEDLCNALLDTIDKASQDLQASQKQRNQREHTEENPIPVSLLNPPPAATITSNSAYYEDISSEEDQAESATENHTCKDMGSDNIGIINTNIVGKPMFTYLIPDNPGTHNPDQLKDISQRVLSQANLIKVGGVTMPSTELKDYDSTDKLRGANQEAEPPTLTSNAGDQKYTAYAIRNKGSPRTWFHVEEGGRIIKVSENLQDKPITTPDCPTPVLDERPSPYIEAVSERPSPPHTPSNSTNTRTAIMCTDPHADTSNIAIHMRATIMTTDNGTSMDGPPLTTNIGTSMNGPLMTDSACSPTRRPTTADIGTDPIVWWLEESRRLLRP
jgi:hypothetical protein